MSEAHRCPMCDRPFDGLAEVAALRASHERLRLALNEMVSSFGFDDPGSERHELMAYQCEALGEARAAIAEARKVETTGDEG